MSVLALPELLLPRGTVPLPVVPVLVLVALGAWWAAFRVFEPRRGGVFRRTVMLGCRLLVGALAMLTVTAAARRFVVFGTPVPLWAYWLGGAVLVELAVALYRAERRRIARRSGIMLSGLRITLCLLVLAMLAQPVFVRESERRTQRVLAVMADESLSMDVPDTGLSPDARVRLAEALGLADVERPVRLDRQARRLEEAHTRLAVQAEWLSMVAGSEPEVLARHLQTRRGELEEEFGAVTDTTEQVRQALAPIAQGEHQEAVERVRQRLGVEATQPLDQATAALGEDSDVVLNAVRRAQDALASVAAELRELGRRLDAEFYTGLPLEQKAAVDAVAGRTRRELAGLLLRGSADPHDGLLQELQGRYAVKTYAFAGEAVETASGSGERSPADAASSGNPAETVDADATDLAAALDRARRDVPLERLAGIILLTDGRHNAETPLQPVARDLSVAGVPVSSVVFGAQRPPRDAAVLSLDVPEAVFVEDRMLVTAELKLDGLAGETLKVALRGPEGEEALDERTVQVPTDRYRPRVELSHTPTTPGPQTYTVAVETRPDEVLADNNAYPLRVNVTEERTRLLVLEGRPRWEFRYLKNLFANRDPSVKLQYVLFDPDRVAPDTDMPVVPASADRPPDQAQATALPESEDEWMKFDVVLLGDVTPESLPVEEQDILRRLVVERGGTLVVVAGPHAMPEAFRRSPLADLLPLMPPAEAAEAAAAEGYRISLTPEGERSVVTRLDPDPETNEDLWGELPDIYWRQPVGGVRPGATVLAYARPVEGEAEEDEDSRASNALIAYQRVGMGRVMMLAFDRTWRMRYRAGDTHHHRFWGQVMRWAAGYRFPAGTQLVKLGTDRPRYAPEEPVHVRARLLQPDLSPLANADVAVTVLRNGEPVVRRTLRYLPSSPGLYEADVGRLPPGPYELRLESPQARGVVGPDELDSVVAEFTVEPGTSREQAELTPDVGPPGRLAQMTGGLVLGPAEAERVLEPLRPPVAVQRERYEYVLWNSWPLLCLIMGVAAAEWLLRKRKALP
ncbi:MAG: hypothetical protein R6X33_05195 [Candidatus Brocadiia bacterium]